MQRLPIILESEDNGVWLLEHEVKFGDKSEGQKRGNRGAIRGQLRGE